MYLRLETKRLQSRQWGRMYLRCGWHAEGYVCIHGFMILWCVAL